MTERNFDGKTVLVTGGAGFIGSHFIRGFLGRWPGAKIINFDKLTYAGNLDNLRDLEDDPRYEFVRGDIRDRDLVRAVFPRVQAVVHFAAETHVDRSILDAGEFVLTDVYGSFILLEALRDSPGIEAFVHISTDEVYGSRDEGYFRETDALSPSSPYAASKTGGDRLAHAYHVTYGLPILIVRPSNNYGPNQYPEKFIPLFTTNALEGKTLPLYGKGTNVRDWLFVGDCCRAVELVLRRGEPGQAYNVGAANEAANIEVARRICDILGKPRDIIKPVADRPGHDRRYAVDWSKIKALGWAPGIPFATGLEETVRWYERNREWWMKIKERSRDFEAFYARNYKEAR